MIKLFGKKAKSDEQIKPSIINRLRQGLSKTRSGFTDRLDRLVLGKKEINHDLLEDLEEILFTSDLGVATTQELLDLVQKGIDMFQRTKSVGIKR